MIQRAKRRFDELKEKGQDCDFDAIKEDIKERDARDNEPGDRTAEKSRRCHPCGQFRDDDRTGRGDDLRLLSGIRRSRDESDHSKNGRILFWRGAGSQYGV